MRADHEELLLRNPALVACAFWHFARNFSSNSAENAPELPHFFIAAGMLFHNRTVEKVRRMQFDSGILKAVSDRPDMVAGLQERIEEHSLGALKALHMGVMAGILCRGSGDGLPAFHACGKDLPAPIRHGDASVSDIFGCAKRFGAWFARENIYVLQGQLNVRF